MVFHVTEPKSIDHTGVDFRRAAACLPTDAILFFSDGSRMEVHRFLLIASSEYWECCFKSQMKEGISHSVNFDSQVDPKAAKSILNYIYYGETYVEDIAETLAVAHMWIMPHFLKALEPMVKEGIDNANVVNIFQALYLRDLSLYTDCVNWAAEHIEEIDLQTVPPSLMALVLKTAEFQKNSLESLLLVLKYLEAAKRSEADELFILHQINWEKISRSGDQGVNLMSKVVSRPLPQEFKRIIEEALSKRHEPVSNRSLFGDGEILPYADLRKGMNVIIMNDPERLKACCLKPAPDAKHSAGWAHNTANLCGLVVEVEGFEESLKAIKFRRGFSEHIIPFTAIAFLGYPEVSG